VSGMEVSSRGLGDTVSESNHQPATATCLEAVVNLQLDDSLFVSPIRQVRVLRSATFLIEDGTCWLYFLPGSVSWMVELSLSLDSASALFGEIRRQASFVGVCRGTVEVEGWLLIGDCELQLRRIVVSRPFAPAWLCRLATESINDAAL